MSHSDKLPDVVFPPKAVVIVRHSKLRYIVQYTTHSPPLQEIFFFFCLAHELYCITYQALLQKLKSLLAEQCIFEPEHIL